MCAFTHRLTQLAHMRGPTSNPSSAVVNMSQSCAFQMWGEASNNVLDMGMHYHSKLDWNGWMGRWMAGSSAGGPVKQIAQVWALNVKSLFLTMVKRFWILGEVLIIYIAWTWNGAVLVLFILQIDFMVKTSFPFWRNTKRLSNFMVK